MTVDLGVHYVSMKEGSGAVLEAALAVNRQARLASSLDAVSNAPETGSSTSTTDRGNAPSPLSALPSCPHEAWAPFASLAAAVAAIGASGLQEADTVAAHFWQSAATDAKDPNAIAAGALKEPLLFFALGRGRVALAERLLQDGADAKLTWRGRTAMHRAVAGGCLALLARLHAAGVALHDADEALVSADGVPQPLAAAPSLEAAREAYAAMKRVDATVAGTVDLAVLEACAFDGDAGYGEHDGNDLE